MAYSFDKVMGQLKGQPDKQDIFGGQSGGSPQGATPGLGSNTEGDLGPSGGSGDVANAKSGANQGPSDVSSSAAYRSNIGKTKGPDLGALKSGVAAKNAALDQEANSYLENRAALQPDKLSDSDTEQLHKAIDKGYDAPASGDGPTPYDTGAPSRSDLGYWSKVASGQVEKVDPFKSALNLSDSTIDNLGTDAGTQNLLRRGAGAEYNAGDAAFDQALLGEDQGFQQGRQDLMDSYRGLQTKQGALAPELTDKAQRASDSARASYLADMKAKLGGFKDQFVTEAQAHEKEVEDAAAKRQQELLAGSGDILAERAKALTASGGDLAQYISPSGISAGSYAKSTFDPNAQDYTAYLNDDQALRFNNIFGLLGAKDIYGKGARADGYADSDLVNYDTAGMDQALNDTAKIRAAAAAADAERQRQMIVETQKKVDDSIAADNHQTPLGDNVHLPSAGEAIGSPDPNKKLREIMAGAGIGKGPQNVLAPGQDTEPVPMRPGGLLAGANNLRKRLRL